METKLVLVVRTDLGMGCGKVAAQVAHAAVTAALANADRSEFKKWLLDGQPKVVLRAGGEQELKNIAGAAAAVGLPVQIIHDAGRTQIPEGTVTCCAVGPANADKIDAITSNLPLL